MSNLSSYTRDAMVNHVTGDTSFTMPANVYVALFTADTGLDTNAPSAEVPNANAYARTAVTFSTSSGGAGANSNSAQVTMPQASGGNWGTVTHFAIVDSATWDGGNVLLWNAMTASRVVNDGDQLVFETGEIDATAT